MGDGTLGADLYELYKVGADVLPEGAGIYREISTAATDNADTLSSALRRTEVGWKADKSGSSESGGPAAAAWQAAVEELRGLLERSAENLDAAGDVMLMTTYAYAEQDSEAAEELKQKAGLDEIPEFESEEWK